MKSSNDPQKKAAHHMEEAARYHFEALKNYEEGYYNKALICKMKANSHTKRASECQTEFVEYQAPLQ